MYSTDHDSKHASEMENTIELQHMEKPKPTDRQTDRQTHKQVNKTELVNKHSATHPPVSTAKQELMLKSSIFWDNMPCNPMKES
jgi:hypothetical protein